VPYIAAGNGIPLASAHHGDVDQVVRRILAGAKGSSNASVPDQRALERGRNFHQDQLVPRFTDLVEALPRAGRCRRGRQPRRRRLIQFAPASARSPNLLL
jgi:hypothetical protein